MLDEAAKSMVSTEKSPDQSIQDNTSDLSPVPEKLLPLKRPRAKSDTLVRVNSFESSEGKGEKSKLKKL